MNSLTVLALHELSETVALSAESIADEGVAGWNFERFRSEIMGLLPDFWPLDQLGNVALEVIGTTVFVGLWDHDDNWRELQLSLSDVDQIIFLEFLKNF